YGPNRLTRIRNQKSRATNHRFEVIAWLDLAVCGADRAIQAKRPNVFRLSYCTFDSRITCK
ncbi:MAG: hypothetical protein VX431_00005, partial [Planctomycetota bacterium]|nr:hypothetical protein [Planctomycetota bacterium]